MSERDIKADIILDLSHSSARLFRQQAGVFRRLHDETHVTIGVPGMSDLGGFVSRKITQDMVGTTVAIYTAIEVKSPSGRTQRKRQELQDGFINMVRAYGGIAGKARSVEDARWLAAGPYGE